jgi:hypothetical protein
MSVGGLWVEDRLAGAGNWSPWKARIVLNLKEGELWDIVESLMVPPTDAVLLAEFRKRNIKAKRSRTILDAVKDHIIPHVSGKDFAFQLWQSLCSLYQSPNQTQKMVLQEKLRGTKMTKTDSVTSFLARFYQIHDELAAVGEIVDPSELVKTALNGFSKPWESFVRGIIVKEHMPSWERLWDDFVQEELKIGSGSTSQQRGRDDGEDLALSERGKKNTKKGPKGGAKQQQKGGEQQRDMSKVKCFACNKMGHYVGQCPNRKKQGGTAASAKEDEFASQFERDMSLLVSLFIVETPSNVWYIDSGASNHMYGVREHFTDLIETRIKLETVLGNNTIVRTARCGTVSFKRELWPPMVFRDILYVPGLKKNLISISTIQDRGFEVSFRGEEVLIHRKGSTITSTRVTGTRDGKLYILSFQPLHPLASSNSSQSCELWHRTMAHLHHAALRVLREIVTRLPQFGTEHQKVYKGCALRKYTKTVFPSNDSRSGGILDLVDSNVCRPMSPVSLGGCGHCVTFIHDRSSKTWIYFLKTKSEVFKRFQEFKALVENQTGRKIKVLRSNIEDEYTSTEFRDFCTQEGIRRQLIVPYNPQ